MVKIIDIDALFDKYISDYVYKNIGKVKPEEIENNIPKLYEKFGKEKLDELGGLTPETYYIEYSAKELLECLKEHIEKGVAVSDFLCEALMTKKDSEKDFLISLDTAKSDEFIVYVMNVLSSMDIIPASRYFEYIVLNYPEDISELATELLSKRADQVKDLILSQFADLDDIKKERFCEVLSYASKDDKVFDLLVLEFARNKKKAYIYAGYLARYGDERALPFLLKAIEDEKITYSDFEEIRFAIEALGGEYTKERDFTKDLSYKKIKGEEKSVKES
ncbi:MAG: hypothetical protein IJW43_05550 [Clostridia bacterium]|nr:hypothetical protein [Clostridia bacterium]